MTTYTREDWGAKPPKGDYTRLPGPVAAVIHHSAGPVPKSVDHAMTMIRSYQWQHMFTKQLGPNGAIDIGYHVLFDGDGNSYDGRPFGTVGAHAPGGNDLAGICLLGNYDEREPSRVMLSAVHEYCRDRGIREVAPHSAFYPTLCPGMHGQVFTQILAKHLQHGTTPRVYTPYPYGGQTLRLYTLGTTYPGWQACNNRIVSIARYPQSFTTEDCAIAWQGFVWRGNKDVVNVCKHLHDKFNLNYR